MKILLNVLYKQRRILLPIILLAIFITVVLIIKTPIKQTFEYNPDEGLELMKSSLFLKGFTLYKEISNDQPPLFTLILSYWFKLFGPSVHHGRILIFIFSCMLLWAFYGTIKKLWGELCGFIAVIFLLLSAFYLRLSISIMIGTASFSLAMLSILCLMLYKESQTKYLLLFSGIFMALSVHTKMSTAFLMPIIASEIIQTKWPNLKDKKELTHLLPPLLLWFGGFLTVYLTILFIFFRFNLSLIYQQLIQPHLNRSDIPSDNFLVIWRMVLVDYDIALLGLTGIILLIRQRRWQYFFPVLWLGAALTVFSIYQPIWDHYYLFVSIPISWLAAISFSQFFISLRRKGIRKISRPKKIDKFLRWVTVAIIALTILRLPSKYNILRGSIWEGTAAAEHRAVELLSKYKEHTRWIVTDRPIFAFYAGILVPPELVLITHKRQFTEHSAQDYCIDKLEMYKPEMILLSELKYYGPRVISYIQKNYSTIYQAMPPYNQITRTYLTPSFYLAWRWEPIGKYLPKRMQIITDKWFYNMVWHCLHIPIPVIYAVPVIKKYYKSIDVKIFIRKDVLNIKSFR